MPDANDLLAQLAAGREKLREERAAAAADRAAAAAKLADAAKLHAAADGARKRARQVAARYLKRNRSRLAAERRELAAAKAAADRDRRVLAAEAADIAADHDKVVAELNEANARVADAREQLAAERQAFADDRARAEAEMSRLFGLLDARTADVEAREGKVAADRRELETRYTGLRAELAGLEQRAVHARLALHELEQQRAKLSADTATAAYFAAATDVAMVTPDGRSAEQIAVDLQVREVEVARERRAVAAARAELDTLADHLTDQRALLAEQFAAVADAQRRWQQDEVATLGELEEIARALEHREAMAAAREEAAEAAEAACRRREAAVWRFQSTLERWQAAVADREAAAAAARERADAAVAAGRLAVADKEAAIDAFCREWDERSAGLRDDLIAEVARWVDDRKACEEATREAAEQRAKYAAEMERLAAARMGVEQAKAELDPRAARRVRVLAKRWATRFAGLTKELAAREKRLAAEAAAVERRYADLRKVLVDATRRQEQADAAERAVARGGLAAGPADEPPVILSLADARRDAADDRLAAARAEAERLADELRSADERAGVLPLRPAA